jgi:hypothetical protein
VVGVGPEMVSADMAYDADGLRAGGAQAGQAAGTAAGVAGALAPVSCEMAMFGMVAGAAGLAAAVLRSRDAHQQLAEQAATVHADVQGRAGQAAADGDGLTAQTTTVARQGTPVAGR